MNKKLYVSTLILGFLLTVYNLNLNQLNLAQVAWFFWSASFLYLPVWFVLAAIEYLISPQKYKNKDRPTSSLSTSIRFFTLSLLTVIICCLFHLMAGLFLSILQPVEPFELFRIEGYNKNFDLNLISYHLKSYFYLGPGFVALKFSLFFIEPGQRLNGHACLRDGIFPLIGATLFSFVFKDLPQSLGLLLFSGFLFLPWTLIFGKDRYDKIATSEAELNIPCQVPIQHTYRPQVTTFWGVLVLFFGLLIGTFVIHMAIKINLAGQTPVFFIFLMGLIGFTVGSGFIFAGMNMLFSYRQVSLTRFQVTVVEKAFLIIIPIFKKWNCQLSEYLKIEAVAQSGVSSNVQTVFVVKLVHQLDHKKNLELYRAYHSEDYQNVAKKWRELLGFLS